MSEQLDGRRMDMTATIDYQKVFEEEIKGLNERWTQHIENAKQADRILLVCGCDDGRVGVPAETQTMPDGSTGLFLFISAIGGGAPSKDLLSAVISNLEKEGVEKSKIEILTTQHGSTEEIKHVLRGDNPEEVPLTCGLRKVLKSGNVDGIPTRLVRVATTTNSSYSMAENGDHTYGVVSSYGLTEQISAGYFDHQEKKIVVVKGQRSGDIPLEYAKWEPTHQDPAGLVISFGTRANTIHDGLVLPESVGVGNSNDFSASALATEDDFLNAMSEIWYAASHHASHAAGHGHDANFEHTKFTVVVCDNQTLVDTAKHAIATEEFQRDFAPVLKPFGGIQLINLETEAMETVSL